MAAKKRKKTRHIPKGFRKVWFSRGGERTAGLVLPNEKLATMSIGDISRLYPYSEAGKMARIHQSPVFETWDEAFAHDAKDGWKK